jgi:hypothetical protein
MPEHYTKSTVSATFWCGKCGKPTEHRISDGRRGACMKCLEKLNEAAEARKLEAPPAEQCELFGGK